MITSDRAAGIRFFEHYRDGAETELRGSLDALVAECKGTMDALATSRDQAAVDVLIQTRQGRDALAAGVKAAQSFGRAVTSAIDQLNARFDCEVSRDGS